MSHGEQFSRLCRLKITGPVFAPARPLLITSALTFSPPVGAHPRRLGALDGVLIVAAVMLVVMLMMARMTAAAVVVRVPVFVALVPVMLARMLVPSEVFAMVVMLVFLAFLGE